MSDPALGLLMLGLIVVVIMMGFPTAFTLMGLGMFIPPSVMIIVYAAVAGQSVVKLYAAAMFPGFFLAFLYLVYIIGWAMINPKIAPALPEEQTQVPVPAWVRKFQSAYSSNMFAGLLRALISPARAKEI